MIFVHALFTLMALTSPLALAGWEDTTDTIISDTQFTGGYTKDELDQVTKLGKEQKAIKEKFMKGRYSSAIDPSSRNSGIIEDHVNPQMITPHSHANNAAEKAGDIVGLGKAGINNMVDRERAAIVQRIKGSDNCEFTTDEQARIAKNDYSNILGVLKGKAQNEEEIANAVLGNGWQNYLEATPSPGNSNFKLIQIKTGLLGDVKQKAEEEYAMFRRARDKHYIAEINSSGEFTGNYRVQCPNISAIVLDRGAAHGADIGEDHRINDLNQKTFTAGTTDAGPLVGAEGALKDPAEQYAKRVVSDSARTAIPPQIIAAMRARGMDVWTEDDGHTVVTKYPDGSLHRTAVEASPDDIKSEVAWMEHEKKFRIDQDWKELRLERFVTGDDYDPTKISPEMGSLLAQNAGKDESETNKIAADRVADYNIYNGTTVCLKMDASGKLSSPGPCPAAATGIGFFDKGQLKLGAKPSDISACRGTTACYLQSLPLDLRSNSISSLVSMNPADLTKAALGAAKTAAESDRTQTSSLAQNKAHLSQRIVECMQRDTWCQETNLGQYKRALDAEPTKLSEIMSQINNDPKLKNLGITAADIKAGTAYIKINGQVGSAFKDTREFTAVNMSKAMEGPLSQFANNVESADFNNYTDSKSKSKFFLQVKRQQAINMKLAQEILDYSEKAYQECLSRGAKNCKRQYDKSNFDPTRMSNIQLFGRNPDRDGTTTGFDAVEINGELTKPEMSVTTDSEAPNSSSRIPASSTSTPFIPRGSAPPTIATPFSPI